ncbi:MAG: diguanylate cyclase [Raoultibacter sp.]
MRTIFDFSLMPKEALIEALEHNVAIGVEFCEYADRLSILYANEGFAKLAGYQPDELTGTDSTDTMLPLGRSDLIKEIKAQSDSHGCFEVIHQLKRKDGTLLWVLDTGILLPQEDGTTLVQSVTVNITAQKEAEEALRAQRKEYEIALRSSNVAIFEYSLASKTVSTQDEVFSQYKMPNTHDNNIEEVIGSGIISKRSEDDFRALFQQIDGGSSSASTTIYANDTNGEERIIELQLIRMLDARGVATHALGVRKDITDTIRFHREEAYGNQLVAENLFLYEANVTQDKILRYNAFWSQEPTISSLSVFSDFVKSTCERFIAPEDAAIFTEKQSSAFLLDTYQNGKQRIAFEYRKKSNENPNVYNWFKATISIIEDDLTHDINIRVYTRNIDQEKQDESKAETERKRHELSLSKSAFTCEINITRDTITLGCPALEEELGITEQQNYSQQAIPAALAKVHPEDRTAMAFLLNYDNLQQAYAHGTTILEQDYRYIEPQKEPLWCKASLQLFEDSSTHDLRCFISIEDIDREKEADLTLLYQAQHDLMTGFYNKSTTKEKIDAILAAEEGASNTHIFFIIDLDYFKLINDRFGHAFGDTVLSQVASKIGDLFRAQDILGRIGGDEFVVFMKNVRTEKAAFKKARELCDTLIETYRDSDTECKLTASVGIAFSGRHGTTYDELYRHSDTALYNAKEQGRNQFSLYHETMKRGTTAVREIDTRQIHETGTFDNNTSEYISRILYESADKRQAIASVLELMGKHYHVSRAYVFENSEDGSCLCNTFEWCNKNIASRLDAFKKIPYSELGDYAAYFGDEGVFYLHDCRTAAEPLKTLFQRFSTKSLVQFPLVKSGKFAGFIGFDECTRFRTPQDREFNDYRSFAHILGIFITEMRALERAETAKDAAFSIVNSLDSYAYVCDPETYELLFINDKTRQRIPFAQVGKVCYNALQEYDEPCRLCPMKTLRETGTEIYSDTHYNEYLGLTIKTTASWINWLNNTKACFINVIDAAELQHNEKEA